MNPLGNQFDFIYFCPQTLKHAHLFNTMGRIKTPRILSRRKRGSREMGSEEMEMNEFRKSYRLDRGFEEDLAPGSDVTREIMSSIAQYGDMDQVKDRTRFVVVLKGPLRASKESSGVCFGRGMDEVMQNKMLDQRMVENERIREGGINVIERMHRAGLTMEVMTYKCKHPDPRLYKEVVFVDCPLPRLAIEHAVRKQEVWIRAGGTSQYPSPIPSSAELIELQRPSYKLELLHRILHGENLDEEDIARQQQEAAAAAAAAVAAAGGTAEEAQVEADNMFGQVQEDISSRPKYVQIPLSTPLPNWQDVLLGEDEDPDDVGNAVIEAVFPCHDSAFRVEFLKHVLDELKPQWSWLNPLRWISGSIMKNAQQTSRRRVYRLRHYFGESSGFYFAFMDSYTRWLTMASVGGLLVYFLSLVDEELKYKAYAMWGMIVSGIWAPLFLESWKRDQNAYVVRWGLRKDMKIEYRNPAWNKKKDNAVQLAKGVYQYSRTNLKIRQLVSLAVLVVCIIFVTILSAFLSDLYVYIKMLQYYQVYSNLVCTLMVTGQGILWGLFIDVILWGLFYPIVIRLHNWENYETLNESNRMFQVKVFAWYYFGLFTYFWVISFIYVPFGRWWSRSVVERILPGQYEYNDELINLKEAFLTPLVVTQLLNLLLEAAVPGLAAYVSYRAQRNQRMLAEKQRELRKAAMSISLEKTKDMTLEKTKEITENVKNLGKQFVSRGNQDIERAYSVIKGTIARPNAVTSHLRSQFNNMMDGGQNIINKITSEEGTGEDEVDVPNQAKPLEAYKIFMPRDKGSIEEEVRDDEVALQDLLKQANLEEYKPLWDYADMMMQFGYTTMFSGVWPFISICAVVNNMLETRSDALKALMLQQRPRPMQITSIGLWYNCMVFTTIFSFFINAGLFTISTGGLEWFMGCPAPKVKGIRLMRPNLAEDTCVTPLERVLFAVLIEHLLFACYFLIYFAIPDLPEVIKKAIEKSEIEFRTSHQREMKFGDVSPPQAALTRAKQEHLDAWKSAVDEDEKTEYV